MPRLLLGPVLRHVASGAATVWVETDRACTVEVNGQAARTFTVHAHHYALVVVDGLSPGETTPYDVRLDGERVWPRQDAPPSVIRPYAGGPLRLAFGSCRVGHPLEPPATLLPSVDPRGHGPDALHALSLRLSAHGSAELPDLLLHIGDQVYADEVSPATAALIRARRGAGDAPLNIVVDFDEYASLYHESWSRSPIRWLLSTVPSAMLFDDHELHDDWNTSEEWRTRMRRLPWWDGLLTAAFSSYWVYQHIGNLPPDEARDDPLLQRGGDLTDALTELAHAADEHPGSIRWSHVRDLGGVRVLTLDSRAARDVRPQHRRMLSGGEWAWARERLRGDVDHLLVVSSLPVLLPHAIHDLEAWSEAVAGGAWGRLAARAGERAREALDLEHWAAFQASFRELLFEIGEVASGRRGRPPASVLMLGGDVHFGYIARAAYHDPGVLSRVYQLVCSPIRNPLAPRFRRASQAGQSRTLGHVFHAIAAAAGARHPPLAWGVEAGPWFDNQLTTLTLDGPRCDVRVERAVDPTGTSPRLEPLLGRRLTG